MLWHNDFHDDQKYLKRATQVSVTDNPRDPVPHGLKGSRPPYSCKCSKCRTAQRRYNREKQAEYRLRDKQKTDELAAKRAQKKTVTTGTVRKGRRTLGEMEQAVIEECAEITNAKPTLVVAAKNLGRSVDDLTGNMKVIALYNSTMKQLMATMAEMRGDKAKAEVTGRRKSGGRLATVGALTKVKRANGSQYGER